MGLIFSPESEGFSLGSGGHLSASACLTEPWHMLNQIQSARQSSKPECSMVSIPGETSTMRSGNSTEPNGEEKQISSQQDGHARTSALLDVVRVLLDYEADYFTNYGESFEKQGRQLSSWKIAQRSEQEGYLRSSESPPAAGILLDGIVFPLDPWEVDFTGQDFSALPTITVCGNHNRKGMSKKSGDGIITAIKRIERRSTLTASDAIAGSRVPNKSKRRTANLVHQIRSQPTLIASDWRSGKDIHASTRRHSPRLSAVIGGLLNPRWAAWWQGFPIGITELEPLVMQLFLK